MDWITTGRVLFTVICFVFFMTILWIAYSKRSKTRYEEAANLPFLEEMYNQEQDAEQKPASNGAEK